jgi:hypothetical protein
MNYSEELLEYEAGQNYKREIVALVDRLITKGTAETSIAPLSKLIGCCYSWVDERGGSHVTTPEMPWPEHERVITDALLKGLRRYIHLSYAGQDNLFSILHGLCQNGRWRACLHQADDAYDFATALSLFALCAREGYSHLVVEAIKTDVATAISEWTGILVENVRWHKVETALFGDVWCEFTGASQYDVFVDVLELIRTTRPQFVPGLVPTCVDQSLEALPDLHPT